MKKTMDEERNYTPELQKTKEKLLSCRCKSCLCHLLEIATSKELALFAKQKVRVNE